MAVPIRTCIGCRRREPAAEMVRLVLDAPAGEPSGRVVVASRSRSGRGASVHPRPACLETGLRPEVLSRAFKRKVAVSDVQELLERITIASMGVKRDKPWP
jgi:predicted RNA-binding protein YlxR (DUF448 family)